MTDDDIGRLLRQLQKQVDPGADFDARLRARLTAELRAEPYADEPDPETHSLTDDVTNEPEMEVIKLMPNTKTATTRTWWTVGIVAASTVLILGIIALTRTDDGAGTPVATGDDPVASDDAEQAIGVAQRFVEARDAWDGETVRSLVADDAVIEDFAVRTVDDYVANSEFDQATGWRFMQPECTATAVGPPVEVSCTYTMENAWSRALGVGPYTGSSFEFVIADGEIQQVTNNFDTSQYSTQVVDVFGAWLNEAHPGDFDAIFTIDRNVNTIRRTTPEAIALVEQYTTEFVASLSDTE
jgi:hypothetical protein